MTATVHPIRPQPAARQEAPAHACAWCGHVEPTVPALLDHVIDRHLDERVAA
jgi:hypothetical protein